MTRKRVATFVGVIGLAVVGAQFLGATPREVEIRYALGAEHGDVTEARIVYRRDEDGAAVQGMRVRYEEGAPRTIRDTVELPPGRFRVEARLRGPELRREVERTLEVPPDGPVRLDL